jgi:hypothetical protein
MAIRGHKWLTSSKLPALEVRVIGSYGALKVLHIQRRLVSRKENEG